MNHGKLRTKFIKVALTGLSLAGCATGGEIEMTHPTVVLETNLGAIRIELFSDEAPVTTENFLSYVDGAFYDGLIFHRVIPGFMVQTGGHEVDMQEREVTTEAIVNESDNGLANLRGTVAMARMQPPHSARSQFFVNLVDNTALDYGARPGGWGYAVFGRVIDGMDVVEAIARNPTGTLGTHQDVPIEPIIIASARRAEDVAVTPPSSDLDD